MWGFVFFLIFSLSHRIGPEFHYLTSYSPSKYLGPIVWNRRPRVSWKFKKIYKLPPPELPEISLETSLRKRRSRRRFYRSRITMEELSGLLWAADGVSGKNEGILLRTSPSAGALYPIYLYFIADGVEGIERGLYVYLPERNSIGLLKEGNFRQERLRFSPQGDMIAEAPLVILVVSFFDRITWKYLDRGYRYAYIEAGNISQNIYLACESYGFSTVVVGAFYDTYVNGLLGLSSKEEGVVLIHPVGRRPG